MSKLYESSPDLGSQLSLSYFFRKMKGLVLAVAVAALIALAFAVPRKERLVMAHECVVQGTCGVHDYTRVARASATQTHKVTLWSVQNNFAAQCPSMLLELSDPGTTLFSVPFVVKSLL